MTAQELNAISADAKVRTALYRAATDRHTHTGATFDYNQPLPPAPNYRPREWETDTKDKP